MDSPIVISIRAKNLRQLGFKNLLHWLEKSNHIYIGRNMTHYVPGAVGSKWKNPFSVKEFGRGGCIKKYEKYIRESKLIDQIDELKGCILGCWCKPDPCHGDVLVKLFNEKIKSNK